MELSRNLLSRKASPKNNLPGEDQIPYYFSFTKIAWAMETAVRLDLYHCFCQVHGQILVLAQAWKMSMFVLTNLMRDYGLSSSIESPSAFYGVFDGHGEKPAADFACYHLPRFILEDGDFPQDSERVIASAFLHTDTAFSEACSSDADLDSGTTALAAVVIGRSLVVANSGDCRAVLSRRGKAVEMSRNHKRICLIERKRIEASGGHIPWLSQWATQCCSCLRRLAYGGMKK